MSEYFYRAARPAAPRHHPLALRPSEPHGRVANGRIVKLFVGQGHGFIRVSNGREVYFHRSDVLEGSSINGLAVGDAVTFELLEDTISGARALRVKRKRR